MEKKIKALKAAYQAKDGAALHKAACSLVAYDRKHPFAALGHGLTVCETVLLAKQISEAPGLFF